MDEEFNDPTNSSKVQHFLRELRALCRRHQFRLSVSGYDSLEVWPDDGSEPGDPLHANGIYDCTKPPFCPRR